MQQSDSPALADRPEDSDPPRHGSRGTTPLLYELFVLGELMVQPLYGALIHLIAGRILGPGRPLSWGILSPLIRRLERDGLITTLVAPRPARPERGQPPRTYAITPAGRERFLTLLQTPTDYSRDTPELFVIKLTKFQFLTPAQRLAVLDWYRGYLDQHRAYYQVAHDEVRDQPMITEAERPWIIQSIALRQERLGAEHAWLDTQIAHIRATGDSERGETPL